MTSHALCRFKIIIPLLTPALLRVRFVVYFHSLRFQSHFQSHFQFSLESTLRQTLDSTMAMILVMTMPMSWKNRLMMLALFSNQLHSAYTQISTYCNSRMHIPEK